MSVAMAIAYSVASSASTNICISRERHAANMPTVNTVNNTLRPIYIDLGGPQDVFQQQRRFTWHCLRSPTREACLCIFHRYRSVYP